jgi:hypothetical protein
MGNPALQPAKDTSTCSTMQAVSIHFWPLFSESIHGTVVSPESHATTDPRIHSWVQRAVPSEDRDWITFFDDTDNVVSEYDTLRKDGLYYLQDIKFILPSRTLSAFTTPSFAKSDSLHKGLCSWTTPYNFEGTENPRYTPEEHSPAHYQPHHAQPNGHIFPSFSGKDEVVGQMNRTHGPNQDTEKDIDQRESVLNVGMKGLPQSTPETVDISGNPRNSKQVLNGSCEFTDKHQNHGRHVSRFGKTNTNHVD